MNDSNHKKSSPWSDANEMRKLIERNAGRYKDNSSDKRILEEGEVSSSGNTEHCYDAEADLLLNTMDRDLEDYEPFPANQRDIYDPYHE